ncbi:hypothetical protein ACFLST_01160, partial [Chloroflexota bacterium]
PNAGIPNFMSGILFGGRSGDTLGRGVGVDGCQTAFGKVLRISGKAGEGERECSSSSMKYEIIKKPRINRPPAKRTDLINCSLHLNII